MYSLHQSCQSLYTVVCDDHSTTNEIEAILVGDAGQPNNVNNERYRLGITTDFPSKDTGSSRLSPTVALKWLAMGSTRRRKTVTIVDCGGWSLLSQYKYHHSTEGQDPSQSIHRSSASVVSISGDPVSCCHSGTVQVTRTGRGWCGNATADHNIAIQRVPALFSRLPVVDTECGACHTWVGDLQRGTRRFVHPRGSVLVPVLLPVEVPVSGRTVHSGTGSTGASACSGSRDEEWEDTVNGQLTSKPNTAHRCQQRLISSPPLQSFHLGKMTVSHWKSAQDPKTGRTYYYHEITRETQWRKPAELASEAERKAMEEKERKQKDFFAAMEANILNSLSQGQVPGTPNPAAFQRRKSSRRPADRPELVRTISTMDDVVLKNMIQRQPSFRNIPQNALSKTASLNPNEFETSKRPSHIDAEEFESFVSLMSDHTRRLDPLQESISRDDDSLPELFSYLPDEGEYSVSECTTGDSTVRSDAGKFNESSLTGFGLTWEETQALKKLATITKEMIQAEKEQEEEENKNGLQPTWKAKDNKVVRDLPREIELDESDDESDDEPSPAPENKNNTTAAAPSFQKAKDIGGRELDFDSDEEDDETTLDIAPTPMQSKPAKMRPQPKTKEAMLQRPEIKRRNTCGTLYVGTTMSAPDKDATIKCVCGVIRTHILSSEQLPYDPAEDQYRIFNDLASAQSAPSSFKFHNDDQPRVPVPSLDDVTKFYRGIFYKAQMEADCIIMSLIYVERLIKRTGGKLRPRAENWRSLMFSCMILSSKVWDDLSMWNADFSQSCPPGVSFPLQRINELELAVLNALSFQVKVPASEYAKYYFLLRSMLIKSGLGGEDLNALDPLDVMGARRLQQVSSQFENLSLGSKPNAVSQRSQSLSITAMKAKQPTKAKLGLEQVVKM